MRFMVSMRNRKWTLFKKMHSPLVIGYWEEKTMGPLEELCLEVED